MTPILYWPDADPDALIDVNSVPLFDVNDEQLLATGDYTAARTFDSYGRGALVDCISCEVTEERNGSYELMMEYPISGAHFDDMELRCIIMAQPNFNDDPQAFRIYSITAPIDGKVTVLARHISYDLGGVPVLPFTATSCAAACSGLISNALVASPFTIGTTLGTIADFKVDVPSSVRSWFGGKEGSLIDVYGGEWAYDNYTCTLKSARGTDRGVVIRYGKNLIDFEQEKNCEEVYTGVLPYWADEEGHQIRTGIINVAGQYDYRRILVLDLSQDFEEQPTKAQLKTRAETYITANNIGVPKVSITLDWAQLNEQVELCDTVTVVFERLGVETTAKCVRTVWDVLKDRYSSIEIGDARTNITDTIHNLQQEEEKQKTSVSNAMLRAIATATALITGNEGGYFMVHDSNRDGFPDETLWMDTNDIETATRVWRFNQAGLGFSSSGYDGPYGLAITMNGEIVADFITTGALSADRISGGTITGVAYNNGSGTFQVDASGNVTANSLSSSNATITGGSLQISSSDTSTNFIRLGTVSNSTVSTQVRVGSIIIKNGSYNTNTYSTTGITLDDNYNNKHAVLLPNSFRCDGIYSTTTSSAANVFVTGGGYLNRSTSSSKRYKDNITEDLGELDPEKLYDLPVVRFRFKEDYIDKDDERAGKDVIGFIAEDVDELYPIAVRHEDGKAEMWESNYIIPAMMKLIQNQKKEIDELKARMERLEARFLDDGR